MSRPSHQPTGGDNPAATNPAATDPATTDPATNGPADAAGADAATSEPAGGRPESKSSEQASSPAPVPLLEPREGLPPLIGTTGALREATRSLAEGHGPVAVDAERASGFRYGHRAFLVQLRRQGAGTVLIDPVTCPDLSGIDAALADTEAVLHAASQDLPCLADLGYRPQRLFDTELAGRLLGYPRVGLGTLVETVLGFSLEKTHSAADWSTRPLPEEWLRYAALDVEVLVELRDALAGQLAEQGKSQWAEQEFAAVLAAPSPGPRPDPWRRTSGIHRVRNRRGLAIVRELWTERDAIARRRDISPTRVLPDAAIIEAARSAPARLDELTGLAAFSGRGARRNASVWFGAVARARALPDAALPGSSAPPGDGPPPTHRWQERDPQAARRLIAARASVAALAEANHLPTENLLPPDAVRRLAWLPPDPAGPEQVGAALAGYGARPWQVGLTSEALAGALHAAAAGQPAPDQVAPAPDQPAPDQPAPDQPAPDRPGT